MIEIKRDNYLNQLVDSQRNNLVKVVTGIRRCGKSYLLFNLFYNYLISNGIKKEQIISLSLDMEKNKEYRNPDRLYKYLNDNIKSDDIYYVLLDEIQFAITDEEIKGKEPIRLYGILNEFINKGNVDIYVTGSNSKFLSSDIRTEFRGRSDEIRVYPLTFSEFMSVYNGDKFDGFNEYYTYGGLPMILDKKTELAKIKYLSKLFTDVYIKDIIERHNLHGSVEMDSLVDVLAFDIGSLTNPTKLSNTFISNGIKTNNKTISTYIDYLHDSFLIQRAKRYDIKGKKYIGSPFKYYFTDLGLRNARLNFAQQEQTHIMENIIYNELVCRGYKVDVGVVEYTRRDKNGKQIKSQLEIDFVCNLGNKKYYIQSAFSILDKLKMEQEQASLNRVDDSYKKIIVVKDYIKMWRNEKGYLIINIYDFLLNKDSLNI